MAHQRRWSSRPSVVHSEYHLLLYLKGRAHGIPCAFPNKVCISVIETLAINVNNPKQLRRVPIKSTLDYAVVLATYPRTDMSRALPGWCRT